MFSDQARPRFGVVGGSRFRLILTKIFETLFLLADVLRLFFFFLAILVLASLELSVVALEIWLAGD